MKDMSFGSRWVLVTGASSGLGLEMATQLARQHKANLILVARRRENLNVLKADLEKTGIRCHVIAADLSLAADVDRVFEEAIAVGDVYGVILNAGVTYFGKHLDMEWSTFQNLLSTNVTSVVRLTSLFAPYLLGKQQGGGKKAPHIRLCQNSLMLQTITLRQGRYCFGELIALKQVAAVAPERQLPAGSSIASD
jgi:short-subunit dehydrogenase